MEALSHILFILLVLIVLATGLLFLMTFIVRSKHDTDVKIGDAVKEIDALKDNRISLVSQMLKMFPDADANLIAAIEGLMPRMPKGTITREEDASWERRFLPLVKQFIAQTRPIAPAQLVEPFKNAVMLFTSNEKAIQAKRVEAGGLVEESVKYDGFPWSVGLKLASITSFGVESGADRYAEAKAGISSLVEAGRKRNAEYQKAFEMPADAFTDDDGLGADNPATSASAIGSAIADKFREQRRKSEENEEWREDHQTRVNTSSGAPNWNPSQQPSWTPSPQPNASPSSQPGWSTGSQPWSDTQPAWNPSQQQGWAPTVEPSSSWFDDAASVQQPADGYQPPMGSNQAAWTSSPQTPPEWFDDAAPVQQPVGSTQPGWTDSSQPSATPWISFDDAAPAQEQAAASSSGYNKSRVENTWRP